MSTIADRAVTDRESPPESRGTPAWAVLLVAVASLFAGFLLAFLLVLPMGTASNDGYDPAPSNLVLDIPANGGGTTQNDTTPQWEPGTRQSGVVCAYGNPYVTEDVQQPDEC